MQTTGSIFDELRKARSRPAVRTVLSSEREKRLIEFYAERLLKWGYDSRNAQVSLRLAQLLARLYAGSAAKGILLQGVPGSGKTAGLRLVCEYIGARWWDAEALYDMGPAVKQAATMCGPGTQFAWQRPHDVCLDEVGGEETAVAYGATSEPVGKFIGERYRMYMDHGWLTHITTNLDPDLLTGRYGERVVSRLNEMCAWIDCGTTDWRATPVAKEAAGTPALGNSKTTAKEQRMMP